MPYYYDDDKPELGPNYRPKIKDPQKPDLYAMIPAYRGVYWACSDGNVYKDKGASEPQKLSQITNGMGYRMVALNGRTTPLGRLILSTFRGEPLRKCQIRYREPRYYLCHLDNLYWNNPGGAITRSTIEEIKRDMSIGYSMLQAAQRMEIPVRDVREALEQYDSGVLPQPYSIPLYDQVHGQLIAHTVREAWNEPEEGVTSEDIEQDRLSNIPIMEYNALNVRIMMDVAEKANRLSWYRLFEHILDRLNSPKPFRGDIWSEAVRGYKSGKTPSEAGFTTNKWDDEGNDL